jgi:peptidoglycan/xylan/chitin deacetylase (PgdA/CDA1 family)
MWRSNKPSKTLYLTLDDGPVPEATIFVLDLLKEKKIKATFFCVGANIHHHPELFRRIVMEGHSVGNHTYHHLNGWNTDTYQYMQDIRKCNAMMETIAIGKHSDKPLFRPPYGKLKRSQSLKIRSDYTIVMWDVLSGDFDKDTPPEKCLSNVMDNIRNGSIVVFHDSIKAKRNMEYALPRFIELALAEGYEFGIL